MIEKSDGMEGIKQMTRAQRRTMLNLPSYSLGEEVWNAISHGMGAGLSVAALVLLMVFTPKTPGHVLSLLGYSVAMVLLYVISTLYHALPVNKGKKVFQILDHCTIFLMIAGTYTPMLILSVRGVTGWVMLGVIWAASIIGIVLNAIDMKRYKKFCMACYICIGWSCIFVIKPLVENLSALQLTLLIVGGVLYTVGAVIYSKGKKLAYMHTIFHLFVVAASVMQFFVVLTVAMGS